LLHFYGGLTSIHILDAYQKTSWRKSLLTKKPPTKDLQRKSLMREKASSTKSLQEIKPPD